MPLRPDCKNITVVPHLFGDNKAEIAPFITTIVSSGPVNQFKPIKSMRRGATQLSVIGLLAVAVVSAIMMGNLIAQGDFLTAYLGLLVVLGLVALQQLKSTFWLVIPFAMVSQLPAISIIVSSLSLGELWILASLVFVSIYWILERRKLQAVFSGPGIWMYGYLAWSLLIFATNPVGLSVAGASEGGFRFYFKIILGFIAFFIIANSSMGEKNAQRIIILLIVGVGLETAFKLAGVLVPQISYLTAAGTVSGGVGFYTWTQLLAVLPAMTIPFIFARYPLNELVHPSKWWVLGIVLILGVMALLSGKRSLAMLVVIYPSLLAFIRGNFLVAVSSAMAGVVGLAFLIGAHSSGFTLPKNTQRILSVVPGVEGLDADVDSSADNNFRETLNRYAVREIRERPFIGEGFVVDQSILYYLEENPGQVLGPGDHIKGAEYAFTSNWHNTWLGISADFGMPAAVIYAFLMISYIRLSLRVLRRLDKKSYQWTLIAGLLAITIGELLRSWHFGHTSLNYWSMSWKVGVLFAVSNWLKRDSPEKAAEQIEQSDDPSQHSRNLRLSRTRP